MSKILLIYSLAVFIGAALPYALLSWVTWQIHHDELGWLLIRMCTPITLFAAVAIATIAVRG